MILRSEQIVKYGDGTMKKLEELGEVPEPILFPNTQVEVEPGEPTMDLEDYIEDVASDIGPKVNFVTELPEAGSSTLNALYVISGYEPFETEYETLFDAGGDTSKMLDGNVGTVIPVDIDWNDFYNVKITGAYKPTGEIWNTGAAVVEDMDSLLGKTADIYDNTNHLQGKFTIQSSGLYVVSDTYGNCVIDKIEGKSRGIYPRIFVTVLDDDTYKWFDIVNKKEVS